MKRKRNESERTDKESPVATGLIEPLQIGVVI